MNDGRSQKINGSKTNSESRHLLRQSHQTNCCTPRDVIFLIHLFFILNQYFFILNYIFFIPNHFNHTKHLRLIVNFSERWHQPSNNLFMMNLVFDSSLKNQQSDSLSRKDCVFHFYPLFEMTNPKLAYKYFFRRLRF